MSGCAKDCAAPSTNRESCWHSMLHLTMKRTNAFHITDSNLHQNVARLAGDVKEFGFRQIPDDGNYTSHFSADLSTPKAASKEESETAFSEARPAAESDLIDLGDGSEKSAANQGEWKDDQQAVQQAIKGLCCNIYCTCDTGPLRHVDSMVLHQFVMLRSLSHREGC